MNRMGNLEKRIGAIESRNARVELDKAWESSWTRRALLAVYTYIIIGVYMRYIGVGNPWWNALVPSIGFFLSTLTLPFFKRWWISKV